MKLKKVRVDDLPNRERVVRDKPLDLARAVMTGQPPGAQLSDREFVSKFATPEELGKVRKAAEARLAARPKFTFLICEKCGFRTRGAADEFERRPNLEDRPCIRCNGRHHADGGHLRAMTKKEISKFLADEAASGKRIAAGMEIQALHEANTARAKEGKPALTVEQFRAARAEQERLAKEWDRKMKAAWGRS